MLGIPDGVRGYKKDNITITKEVIEYIKNNKEALIKEGVIKEVEFPSECTHCGKNGDIWLTVIGDGSTAICLDCAEGVILNSSIEVNCLAKSIGTMNYF